MEQWQIDGKPNPFFPYIRQPQEFQTLAGAEKAPMAILEYLLDLPRTSEQYEPPDDNNYPRCRFWKYLYYDSRIPLFEQLPTGNQKRQIIYNGEDPEKAPDITKGYRLFIQTMIPQTQRSQQTVVRITTGYKIPNDDFHTEIAIQFQILTSMEKEYLQHGVTRTEGIEQAIIESLCGVPVCENIGGIGGIYFTRRGHVSCGSQLITDGSTNIGRLLTMGVSWASTVSNVNYG